MGLLGTRMRAVALIPALGLLLGGCDQARFTADLVNRNPLRLFTDEELPVGDYAGVRLLFDDNQDDSAVATNDGDFPLLIGTAGYAAVDFTVEEDKESRETLTLALDLRQTLSFDEADEADEDALDVDDDLDFRNVRNVQIDDGELLERDLD